MSPIPRQVLSPRESLVSTRCPSTVRRPIRLRRQQPQPDCEFSVLRRLTVDDPRPRSKNARRRLDFDGLIRRSEEHTSELQSQFHLVCRLLLEKKKKQSTTTTTS